MCTVTTRRTLRKTVAGRVVACWSLCFTHPPTHRATFSDRRRPQSTFRSCQPGVRASVANLDKVSAAYCFAWRTCLRSQSASDRPSCAGAMPVLWQPLCTGLNSNHCVMQTDARSSKMHPITMLPRKYILICGGKAFGGTASLYSFGSYCGQKCT